MDRQFICRDPFGSRSDERLTPPSGSPRRDGNPKTPVAEEEDSADGGSGENQDDPGPGKFAHSLRGGSLSQLGRVLLERHGNVSHPWKGVHPALRVLCGGTRGSFSCG